MARVDRGPGLQAPGGRPQREPASKIVKTSESGEPYIDYKDTEFLKRMMSNNGKVNGRRRNLATATEQRMIARAVKRARFMALLPYTETTA